MHRCRLAIGAGDPDELQLARRMLERLGREIRERRTAVLDDSDRDFRPQLALSDDRDGAARHRLGCELVPVAVEPLDRDEERPGRDPPRVVRDGTHVELVGAGRHRDLRAFE